MTGTFTQTTETIAELMKGVQIGNFNLGNFNPAETRLVLTGGQRLEAFVSGYEEGGARLTMLASEPVLRREWSSPEENEAWEDL
jgi:hypothetical protein